MDKKIASEQAAETSGKDAIVQVLQKYFNINDSVGDPKSGKGLILSALKVYFPEGNWN